MSKEIVLQPPKRSRAELVKTSRQQSAIVLVQMLDRAAARTGHELTEGESEDWIELLEQEPGPGIRWAFMEHAKVSEFFPKPSEILGLIRTWRMVETQKGADEADRLQRQELEHRAANGEGFYGLADVMAEFRKVIDAKTELTPEQKKTLKGKVDALKKSTRKRAGA